MTSRTPATVANEVEPSVTLTPEADGRSIRVEAWSHGRSVSRCWVVSQRIRIGAALVRMDGIGGVGTDGDHRRQGYAGQVLEAAIEHMRGGDAGLSMLYGISGFYERFGYVPAGPEHLVSLAVDEHAPLPGGWSCKPAADGDLPHLRAVYDAATRDAVGAAVRLDRAYAWRTLAARLAEGDSDDCLVLWAPNQAIRGYVRHGTGFWAADVMQRDAPGEMVVAEALALDAESADAALAVCARAPWRGSRKHHISGVLIPCPHDGPVAAAAMRRNARLIRAYSGSGGSMARIIRLRHVLRDLAPELSRRLRARGLRPRKPLLITTEDERVLLAPRGSTLEVGEPPEYVMPDTHRTWDARASDLAQLVLGARPPGDILDRGTRGLSARDRTLVEALFPQRCPHMHLPDRY